MNLWAFRGNPPTNGLPVEIIIADFDFVPMIVAQFAGDYDRNGAVDQEELDLALNHWGNSNAPGQESVSIPDPANATALTAFAGSLLASRRHAHEYALTGSGA